MLKRFLGILSIIITSITVNAQTLNIATYNLRNGRANDGENSWEKRSAAVINLIRYHDFDIFGTQEGYLNQLTDIATALPDYARYGKGRDDGKEEGEHSAIFYKKDKFTLLQCGDFWLSETPDKPGLGWDATCCNRICSWVQLQDKKSGRKFFFFNVHYDHEGKVARVESSKLMLKKIAEITKGAPTIFTGDFNGDEKTEWYKILAASAILRDSYNDVKYPYENNSSYNGFGQALQPKSVIDHIFVTKNITASKWGILTDTYMGKYPSDHFPVQAFIKFK